MNNYLRTSSIVRVMEAMRATAPRFEEFGGRLMACQPGPDGRHQGSSPLAAACRGFHRG